MIQSTAGHYRVTRLLLAVLMVAAPLLSYAGGMPMPAPGGVDNVSPTAHQMPCHAEDGQATDPVQPACPHCNGEDPVSQCQCCSYAAPAGIAGLGDDTAAPVPPGVPPDMHLSDPLPESSGDRLYRPPIFPG